jgi:hypothetical protein
MIDGGKIVFQVGVAAVIVVGVTDNYPIPPPTTFPSRGGDGATPRSIGDVTIGGLVIVNEVKPIAGGRRGGPTIGVIAA